MPQHSLKCVNEIAKTCTHQL